MDRFISVLALLLICSTSSAYGVEFTFTDVVKTKHSTVDYNELTFGRQAAYGQYEKFEYTFGSKMDVKQREPMMQATIISTANSPATEFEKFNILKFNKGGHEYILKLKVYVKTASVEILKKASYTPFVRLDGTSWPLQKKLAKKATDVPLPPIVPVVENAAVSRLKFTNYDEVTFRAGKQRFPVKGKIWEVEYRLDAYKKTTRCVTGLPITFAICFWNKMPRSIRLTLTLLSLRSIWGKGITLGWSIVMILHFR